MHGDSGEYGCTMNIIKIIMNIIMYAIMADKNYLGHWLHHLTLASPGMYQSVFMAI